MRLMRLLSGLLALTAGPGAALAQFQPPPKPAEPTVVMLGWADYVAPQVMEDFGRETGIRVIYDTYESEAGLEARLAEAKGVYDIVLLPGKLLGRMIGAGALQKLDHAVVPQARELWPEIGGKLAALDPGGQYALVHAWFGYGLAFDRARAADRLQDLQLASWDTLFRPDVIKKFSNCGVLLPDDADLVLEVALMAGKFNAELRGAGEVKRAGELAGRLRANVSDFRNGAAAAALADGEACLALVSAPEAAQARARGKAADPPRDIGFVFPKEGAPLAADVAAVVKDAPHVIEAMKFLSFLQRPENAARNASLAGFAPGVLAVKSQVSQTVIMPDDETLKRMVIVPAPEPGVRKTIEREWRKVKTGSYEPAPEPVLQPGKTRPGGTAAKTDNKTAKPDSKHKATDKASPPPPKPVEKTVSP